MKLKNILLIDDDELTNFVNKRILTKFDCTGFITVTNNGQEAIDYLTASADKDELPKLILLDINMPVMNGWEFLEEYKKLPDNKKADVVLMMLSTSLNPEDAIRAESMDEVMGFLSKPLTKESIMNIIEKNFTKERE